jgi:predicted porin
MRYKRLAVTLAATFPLLAAAQSNLTIYGIADAALASEDDGGPNGRHTVLNSGNQSNSRLGFRGSEEINSNMKALFNLEMGVAIDTGAEDAAGLFQRRAVVGLEGNDWGTLTLGREYSPIASIGTTADIFGQGFYGSNLSAFNVPNRLTRRLSNSMNYKSPAWYGFKLLGAYAFGENPGGTGTPSGDLGGVAVEYANGPLYLGVGWHTFKRVSSGNDKQYAFGAGFKWGDFEFQGNWLVADPEGPKNRFQQYNVGASWEYGPGKVYVNLQDNKLDTGAGGYAYAFAYTYALSKRTNLYTTYASMQNNTKGLFGLNSAGTALAPPPTSPGADPSVFNVGLRHTF